MDNDIAKSKTFNKDLQKLKSDCQYIQYYFVQS